MKTKLPGILCVKKQYAGGADYHPDVIRGERRVVLILSNGRGGPLGTAVYNRIVKNTYEKGFPGNPVCKKTIRETCDVQKHTMKCRFPGILCVKKNNTRRVFGPKMRPAPQRESFPGNPVCKKTVRGGWSGITRTPSGEEGEYFHIE